MWVADSVRNDEREENGVFSLPPVLARLNTLVAGNRSPGNTTVNYGGLVPCVSSAAERHRLVSGYEKNQTVNMSLFSLPAGTFSEAQKIMAAFCHQRPPGTQTWKASLSCGAMAVSPF